MIPYILAAIGGYLIGDSLKGKQYAEGGRIWSEIRSDFEDNGYVYIDGFISEDDNEEGKVIAKVRVPYPDFPLDKNYGVSWGVEYLDDRAKTDSFAQEVIQEVLDSLKREHRTHMPPPTPSYAKGGMMARGYSKGGFIELELNTNIDAFDKHYNEIGFTKKELSEPYQKDGKYFVKTKDESIVEQLVEDGFVKKYADGGMMAKGGLTQSDNLQSLGKKELKNIYFDAIYKNWEKIDSKNAKEYAKEEMNKSKFRVLNEKQFEQILPSNLGVEEKRIYQINGKQKKLIDIFERSIMFGKKSNWERI